MRNAPARLQCANTWSLAGGIVREGHGTVRKWGLAGGGVTGGGGL